jgi:cob(I)alamin adenosyltransferase
MIELLKKEQNTLLAPVIGFLENHQHRIFDLGGELSIPGYTLINNHHVKAIESFLDELNTDLDPLENFILPGGSVLIAQCHLTRSVCRRAERRTLALADTAVVNPFSLQFLNRFSDCLFVIARYCAKGTRTAEVLWQK